MSLLNRLVLCVVVAFAFVTGQAQTLSPNTVPQMFNGRYYQFRSYVQVDSALMLPARDTNVRTIHPSVVYRSQDSSLYYFDKVRWRKVGSGSSVETDPTVGLHIKALTTQDTANFKMAARKYPVAMVFDSATRRLNLTLNDNSVLFDTINVAASGGSDNWGTQSVVTNSSLIGNGTAGSPLRVDTFRMSTNLRLKKVIDSLGVVAGGAADGNNFPTGLDFTSSILTLGRNNLPALSTIINTTSVGEGTNQYFTNARARAALSAGTGIGYSSATGVITNTAPDVPVGITGGSNVTVTGSYPNFTISASGGSGEANTGSNLGASGVSVFAQKSGVDLQFRKLIAGTNVTLTQNANDVTISATTGGAGGEVNTASNLATTGVRVFAQKSGVDLQFRRLNASTGLSIAEQGDSIVLTNTAPNQAVSITGGTNVTVTGPYPNFTISSAGEANTGSNLGVSGGRVFAQKSGVDMQFRRLVAGSGVSVSEGTNDITFSNTAPDQAVTISAGANTTVTGLYPNFTIASNPVNLYNSNGSLTGNRTLTGANFDLTSTGVRKIIWGASSDSNAAIATFDRTSADPLWEARTFRYNNTFFGLSHLRALSLNRDGLTYSVGAFSNLGDQSVNPQFRIDSAGKIFQYTIPSVDNAGTALLVRNTFTGEYQTRDITTVPNLYNSNGTLTGNRTVSMGSFTLTFGGPIFVNSHSIGRGGLGNSTNVKVGLNALDSSTSSANNNTAMGQNAGAGIVSGNSNAFFGHNAGRYSKGDANTYIGRGVASVFAQTTASARNTAIGEFALGRITTGDDNNAFGSNALTNLSSGNNNTVVGGYAGGLITTGSQNTIIGVLAGASTNGDNNIYIGEQSGYFHKGNSNIFIGRQAGYGFDSSDNRLVIHNNQDSDPLIHGNFAADSLRINGALSVRDVVTGDLNDRVLVWNQASGRIRQVTSGTITGGGSGESNTASNLGASGASLFAQKSGVDLQFRKLIAGTNVTITENTNDVTISATAGGGGGEINTGSNLGSTGARVFAGKSGVDLQFRRLIPGSGLSVTENANDISVVNTSPDQTVTITAGANTNVTGTYPNFTVGTTAEANTASNVGTGQGVFAQKSGADLQFKSVKAGTGISLSATSTELTVNTSAEANTASNLGTGSSVFAQKSGVDLQFKTLKAGSNVTLSQTSTEVTINASASGGVVAEKGIISPSTFWGPAYGLSPNNSALNQILKVGSSGNDMKTITMNIVYFIPASSFPGVGQWVQIGTISDATYRPTHSIYSPISFRIDATRYANFAGTAFTGSADYDKATIRIDPGGQVYIYIGSISSYPQLSGSNIIVVPIAVTYFQYAQS